MKKKLFSALLISACFLISCDSSTTTGGADAEPTPGKSDKSYYFDVTVDGKEMHIDAANITGSFRQNGQVNVFKIFAGKEGEPTVVLTIPCDMTKPCSVANGSATDFNMEISQGSVSLQNFPEKNFTTNNFNVTYPEMSVVTPDAVVITATEKEGNKARIVSGTFNTTTYGSKDSKDPKDANHKVSGKFRIRHEFSSYNGGEF